MERVNIVKITALAGGVGGAKLADGLAQVVSPENLTIVVNTGDDFTHLGLYICPDLDTVCYTLAGIANPETGWGRAQETWNALAVIDALGGPEWFRLGDRDLGLHIERTRRLAEGKPLSEITQAFCKSLAIQPKIIPMSDDSVPTWVYTEEGDLTFQEYFVHRRCEPVVTGFKFMDKENAHPAPGVLQSINDADLVVICPSNPWVSVDPILSIPGVRTEIENNTVLAVSPIIGGKAVKVPAAKMFAELGIEPSAYAVAEHYGSMLDGLVIDNLDVDQAGRIKEKGIQPYVTDTLMKNRQDRKRLAEEVIEFGAQMEKSPTSGG